MEYNSLWQCWLESQVLLWRTSDLGDRGLKGEVLRSEAQACDPEVEVCCSGGGASGLEGEWCELKVDHFLINEEEHVVLIVTA